MCKQATQCSNIIKVSGGYATDRRLSYAKRSHIVALSVKFIFWGLLLCTKQCDVL
jgi:hypothetical protein